MNLAEWAESQGIARVTAYRWFRAGKLPVPARKVGGLILVDTPDAAAWRTTETVVYARVSSADQKSDLDRQVARVTLWATGQAIPVDRVVTEVGSALNGRRTKFLALLRNPSVGTIVVEHRTGLRGSRWTTSRLPCRPRGAHWWSWTTPRSMTTWSGI